MMEDSCFRALAWAVQGQQEGDACLWLPDWGHTR